MQPLFAVPPPSNETPPYYPYNAWSSLPLALPFLVDPTSVYGSISGVLAITSFRWWWSGDEQSRIIDVACVSYFFSYPAAVSYGFDNLPIIIASTSLTLGLVRWDKPLQLVLGVSTLGTLIVIVVNKEYIILASTLLALASKALHTTGLQTMGTAFFHILAGLVMILIQSHNWEESAPTGGCMLEFPQ